MKEKILTGGVFALLIALFVLAANDGQFPWQTPPAPTENLCKEHQVEESKCEKCNPQLARGGTFAVREREPREGECPNTLVRVTLGPDAAKRAGIELIDVKEQPIAESLQANAETLYAPSAIARIAPRRSGVVREVKAILGQEVEAGTVLAVVDAPDLGQAKADLLQAAALVNLREQMYDKEKELAEKKITAGRELLQASAALEEANLALQRAGQTLQAIGLSVKQINDVVAKRETSPILDVRAPFAGTVVEASAVLGETVSAEKPLFAVANLDQLWITIDVAEADLPKIAKDQKVSFAIDALPGRKFAGRIVAVGGEIDERSRTARVYADIKNNDGLLRARMFGRARIAIKSPSAAIVVPKAAVQSDGDCSLVFVSPTENIFQARKVQLGNRFENGFEILVGLAAGEKIVTTGSFLLKAEVLRGEMGAG